MSKNRLIYVQARNLRHRIPRNSNVHIHWDSEDNPIVLPDKVKGFPLIHTVSLSSILNRQCWLDS